MPRKKPSLLTLEPLKTKVDVTLQKSNLAADDGKPSLYGSISRKKVTVRSIIAEMARDGNLPISKELMFYVAEELSRLMMDKFKDGYSVELLDFGTIYPTMKGSIKQNDTPSAIKKHFNVGFAPSKEACAAVKNMEVGEVFGVAVQHCIFSVHDPNPVLKRRNCIISGRIGEIKGKGIKLGGAVSGLYVVPVMANHVSQTLPDRAQWVPVTNIKTNKPATLLFYAPNFAPGSYLFIIETSLSAGNKPLKKSVIIHSEIVQVEEEQKTE